MPTSEDFYASAVVRRTEPLPPDRSHAPTGHSRRLRGVFLAVGLAIAALAMGVLIEDRSSGPVDLRPMSLPGSVNGLPLRVNQTDPANADASQIVALLKKIFGTRPAVAGIYATTPTKGDVYFLVAGRGPITKLGDVKRATADRQTFGEVTCGGQVYQGTVIGDVCWYSSPTLGIDIQFLGSGRMGDKAVHAQLVADLIPVLRGDPAA